MAKVKKPNHRPDNHAHFVANLFKKLGQEEKIKIQFEPTWNHAGKIIRPDGSVTYFRGTNFDLNGLGAMEIAKDKAYAAYFLKLAGYSVIPTKTFYSPELAKKLKSSDGLEAAYQYAKDALGFPVILKPNSASQGELVCLVNNRSDFMRAGKKIFHIDRVLLVQPKISGRDYRVVALGNEVISAYERRPLAVTGDGKSTISQLLDSKQAEFKARQRDTIIDKSNFRLDLTLKNQGLKRSTILPKNDARALLVNANLSTGGEAIDVTSQISTSYKNLAINITRDMGLAYCGVDLMIQKDIRQPFNKKTNNYQVIEINASPGLDHYAESGAKQKKIVKEMYRKILRKLARPN